MCRRVLLFLFLGASACLSAHALTLSDIRVQVRRNVSDVSTDGSLQAYSDADLLFYINEVQVDAVNRTWALSKTTDYSLVAGTTFYSLPNDYIAALHVEFKPASNNNILELEEISEKALRTKDPAYQFKTGPPNEYFVRYSTRSGTQLEIVFYPVATSNSTGTVRVLYYCQPTDLSSDSDVPFNSQRHLYPYHHALIYGATFRILQIQGRTTEAALYRQLYDTSISVMDKRLQEMPNYTPAFSGPNLRQ